MFKENSLHTSNSITELLHLLISKYKSQWLSSWSVNYSSLIYNFRKRFWSSFVIWFSLLLRSLCMWHLFILLWSPCCLLFSTKVAGKQLLIFSVVISLPLKVTSEHLWFFIQFSSDDFSDDPLLSTPGHYPEPSASQTEMGFEDNLDNMEKPETRSYM